jgi:hypothetical protein
MAKSTSFSERRFAHCPEAAFLKPVRNLLHRGPASRDLLGRTRDLAIFSVAMDCKLRSCDVVSLKVDDIAPHGQAADRAMVRQKQTGRPVGFERTEQTRESVSDARGLRSFADGLSR